MSTANLVLFIIPVLIASLHVTGLKVFVHVCTDYCNEKVISGQVCSCMWCVIKTVNHLSTSIKIQEAGEVSASLPAVCVCVCVFVCAVCFHAYLRAH